MCGPSWCQRAALVASEFLGEGIVDGEGGGYFSTKKVRSLLHLMAELANKLAGTAGSVATPKPVKADMSVFWIETLSRLIRCLFFFSTIATL